MNKKWKSILAYLFYAFHLFAVIYFGINESDGLFGYKYQKTFSLFIVGIGIVIYTSAYFQLGIAKSSGITFTGLLKNGIYKLVRHPQILAWILILTGISLYLDSLVSLILTFILWIFFKTILQPFEEKQLIKEYGQEYLEYKRKTVSGI